MMQHVAGYWVETKPQYSRAAVVGFLAGLGASVLAATASGQGASQEKEPS
jgi:hypothetical protein